jgi:hypothetical protein
VAEEQQPASIPHLRRDWDGVAAVIAAFVGLLALCVSGYTAWLQQRQVSAQVWPHLMIASSSNDADILIINKGVGPALVGSMQVFVDGEPQRDWNAVLAKLDIKVDEKDRGQSTVNGNVISAGESVASLKFNKPEDFLTYFAKSDRVKMRVCYCSVLNECWERDTRQTQRMQRDHKIDRCERNEASEFHDYVE